MKIAYLIFYLSLHDVQVIFELKSLNLESIYPIQS